MQKILPPTSQLVLNSVDRLGRQIEPCVLSAANEIAPQALSYAANFVRDPCVAMNLLEEAAASVSEAVRAKEAAQVPPIRDMRAYLYRAFLRRIAEERRNEDRVQEAIDDHFGLDEAASVEAKVERKLALKQILSVCDRKTLEIIWGRIEGRSWDDIAYGCVMSNHAARVHYSKVVRDIREALKTDQQRYIEKVKREERRKRRKSLLVGLFETAFAVLLFRALRVKEVFRVLFRVTHHEKEDTLAEVDRMFA
ncbi:MAG TPA: hypothetical protein VE778_05160 [Candidatus Bathyarchaeia archaeon]|nr:hypothetical protein [Candidatus Bathyarchaeia archaeon]